MKILSYIFLLFCFTAQSQSIDTISVEKIIVADSLFQLKKYSQAIPLYKEVEKRNFFPPNEIFNIISVSYYLLLEKDSSLAYMVKAIEKGKLLYPIDRDSLTERILEQDTSGKYLQKLWDNNRKYIISDTNAMYPKLLDSLKVCYALDQNRRKNSENNNWEEQNKIDSINRLFLISIIKNLGKWPGYEEVGTEGAKTCFLIAQHADKDSLFQKKCIPLIHQEVLNNNCRNSNFGYLMDRYLLKEKGYQFFGTQVEWIEQERKYQPKGDKFNYRYAKVLRYYFSLEPLQEYFDFMIERYKS